MADPGKNHHRSRSPRCAAEGAAAGDWTEGCYLHYLHHADGTRPETGVLSMAELVNKLPGQDPALLPNQEGAPMAGVGVEYPRKQRSGCRRVARAAGHGGGRQCRGRARGGRASEPQIIVDLAALEFIDSSGVAALVRGRNLARHAGGELLLAAPQQQVLRVLTLTPVIEAFPLHATVDEAAGYSGARRRCRCCRGGAARAAGRAAPYGQRPEPWQGNAARRGSRPKQRKRYPALARQSRFHPVGFHNLVVTFDLLRFGWPPVVMLPVVV